MRPISRGHNMRPIKNLVSMFHTKAPKPNQKLGLDVYTKLAEIPIPVSAQFRSVGINKKVPEVEVTYAVRDHVENIRKTRLKIIPLSDEHRSKPRPSKLSDTGSVVAQTRSSSNKLRAVFRAEKNWSSPTRQIVELWKEGTLIHSVDVTGHHGDFYADEYLASFSFSASENSLVYSAERNPPSSDDPFAYYRFNPDFGESLVGKRSPSLFLLKWDTQELPNSTVPTTIRGPIQLDTPSNIRFGQATFSPLSENVIYATGYEYTPDGRILGLRGCFNRPSGIWKLTLPLNPLQNSSATSIPVTTSKITPPNLSCRSPRTFFHGSNAKLIWLSAATGGPHLSTDMLYSADITPETSAMPADIKPLVDVVNVPQKDGFPGLYAPYNLPSSPLLKNHSLDPLVITYSQWGSRTTVLSISSVSGKVKDLTPDEDGHHFSWSVLATDGESRVLATRSSLNVPYELMLGTLNEEGNVRWRVLERPVLPKKIQDALDTMQTMILPVPGRAPVETIVTQSSLFTDGGAIPPCITWPHGGPHAGASTEFSPLLASLVLEGYTISQPNYTGSLGYGDTFARALLGRCGELDVKDCMASAEHLISLGISERLPGKQLVTGGSHGGFLTGHLIGQYPTFFSAAVLRNAVTSATNISTTDIPDWYFSEFGFQHQISSSPTAPQSFPTITPTMYDALLKASPISEADNVCIPVLILAGADDRRVAPSHSVEYYHALKGRVEALQRSGRVEQNGGLDVELLVFKGEGHSLDGVETSRVNFEVIREWFRRVRN